MGAPVWEQHPRIEDALSDAPYGNANAPAGPYLGPLVLYHFCGLLASVFKRTQLTLLSLAH
jgi:hypothetical protein